MKRGISTAKQTTTYAPCLASKQVQVVLRYYSRSAWKRLSVGEARSLSNAGIELGMFYEDGPTSATYFTKARGKADGKAAWGYAQKMGQPVGTCIYFTVDYDATDADIPAVVIYFRGVQTAMAKAAAGGATYKIGVYGSGRVCNSIRQSQGLATYSCLAMSRKWAGTATYKDWDILQSNAKAELCSLQGPRDGEEAEYEPCQLQDSFGGFS